MPRLRRSDCSSPGILRRGAGAGSNIWTKTASGSTTRRCSSASASSSSRPPGRTSGSAPTPSATSRRRASTRPGASSTSTTTTGATRRDQEKFDEMLGFAARAAGDAQARVPSDLARSDGLTRERVLACAVRLLDRGFFRVGGEDYAERERELRPRDDAKRHVTLGRRARCVFDYAGEERQARVQSSSTRPSTRSSSAEAPARRRRELLAYKRRPPLARRPLGRHQRVHQGGHRRRLLRQGLPHLERDRAGRRGARRVRRGRGDQSGRKRAVTRAVKEVAHYLGNTPAVCRASYIDPRVFDRYRDGITIGGALDHLGDGDLGDPPRGAPRRRCSISSRRGVAGAREVGL